MLKILQRYIKDENMRYRREQREIISSIIKLKRVPNGLWEILDEKNSKKETESVEMIELGSRKNEFILPQRERLNTI